MQVDSLCQCVILQEKREQQRQAEQQMLMQKQQQPPNKMIGMTPGAPAIGQMEGGTGLRVDIEAARRNMAVAQGVTPMTPGGPRMVTPDANQQQRYVPHFMFDYD